MESQLVTLEEGTLALLENVGTQLVKTISADACDANDVFRAVVSIHSFFFYFDLIDERRSRR